MKELDAHSVVEAVLWAVPGVIALALFRAGPRGGRATWGVVAASCGAIVLDKLVDLQIHFYRFCKAVVHGLDPERMRAEHLWMRVLLLGSMFAAGVVGVLVWTRLDRTPSAAKRMALAGLVLVLAFLGARLMPAITRALDPPRDLIVEVPAWLLVLGGTGYGWMTKTREPVVETYGGEESPGSR